MLEKGGLETEIYSVQSLTQEPGPSRPLQPGLVWIKHQVTACWLVRGGLQPIISAMAGCVCPRSSVQHVEAVPKPVPALFTNAYPDPLTWLDQSSGN